MVNGDSGNVQNGTFKTHGSTTLLNEWYNDSVLVREGSGKSNGDFSLHIHI